MYEIRFNGTKVQKKFNKLKQKLSNEVKTRMKEALENNPYPSPRMAETAMLPQKLKRRGKYIVMR